ncbi:ribonuclease H-like [Lineus longissimus]|uniref:ribonuclease H-like n=1 Tax=Lineus longissimus TaxID=88925 RepID=UPI00315C6ABF
MSPKIETDIPRILAKQHQTDEARKALALEHIHHKYPSKKWTRAHTDGSAAEATKDGGAGILIKFKAKEEEIAIPTGRYSSNFRAEATALQEAAKRLAQGRRKAPKSIVIFTDALFVLEAHKNPRSEDLDHLITALNILCNYNKKVVLQWIPTHCDIRGNERVDRLANEGIRMEQTDLHELLLRRGQINSQNSLQDQVEKQPPRI